jgi:hypothetical protein
MEGIASNHHFLRPDDGTECQFLDGDYTLQIYVKKVSASEPEELSSIRLRLSDVHAKETEENTGIYFDWGTTILRPSHRSCHFCGSR